ncbi:MAG: FAD-dependent oxidoreductase [Pseudomonadota bacterium]
MTVPLSSQRATRSVDVAIVGAGPAGGTAALTVRSSGLSVTLIDEAPLPGGQVWRALPTTLDSGNDRSPDRVGGDTLRAALSDSDVDWRSDRRVWSVLREDQGFRVDAIGPSGSETFLAPSLIVASGTHERTVPFPGWTLPGVTGLAAATILLKAQHVLPGQRVVVAGAGPLLAAVTAGILKAGGEVAAIVDLNGSLDWLSASGAILTRPALAARGVGWIRQIVSARTPFYRRHCVIAAEGDTELSSVRIAPVDATGAPQPNGHIDIAADSLVIGNGLVPATEITRLLRAEHKFDRNLGGWCPVLDGAGRTSIDGLYVAGDGGGVLGVDAATVSGRQVAEAVAEDAKAPAGRSGSSQSSRTLPRFGAALAHLARLRPAQVSAIPAETVVCRCEDVTRNEIDAAISEGADEVNQIKHFTRCGMGPCQGRFCGDIVAELLALDRAGTDDEATVDRARAQIGSWTARVPLRPVALDALIGDFDYADIPVPPPAPL